MSEEIEGSTLIALPHSQFKEVECLKCGWVGHMSKLFPLKLSWCGGCRAGGSYLRLYKEPAWMASALAKCDARPPRTDISASESAPANEKIDP